MFKIRKNIFETNSSSTHAIAIPTTWVEPGIYGDSIEFDFDEYGWRNDFHDFKNYLWTAINYLDGDSELLHTSGEWEDKIRTILSPYYKDIIFNKPTEKDWFYIDHGYELVELLNELYNDDDLLLNAIFYGEVATSNDNCYDDEREGYCNFIKEHEELEDYVYIKGN